jgi:hypothetical protein
MILAGIAPRLTPSCDRIVLSESRQHSDPAHSGRLLRPRRERPRDSPAIPAVRW